MSTLGDHLFACYLPLKIEVLSDTKKNEPLKRIDEESYIGDFLIKDTHFYTGRGKIENEMEKKLIFELILHDIQRRGWKENNYTKLTDDEKIDQIIFDYTPLEPTNELCILGSTSSIIATRYNLMTAPKGKIKRLSPAYENVFLKFLINSENEERQHLYLLKQRIS